MGLIDLFWNMHQERRISVTQEGIGRQSVDMKTTQQALDQMQESLDRLALVNRALWELTAERTGLTEADLAARVEAIDLRDGVRDGRMGPTVVLCSQCGRRNTGTRLRCLYCGTDLPFTSGTPG